VGDGKNPALSFMYLDTTLDEDGRIARSISVVNVVVVLIVDFDNVIIMIFFLLF
jgi:hypothetical protein